ncbi:MAG TPA: radical SAM protein [Bacteroidales bacterium]|nr:radical SAM protein [Bacteroidales bacterium]
MIFNDEFRNNFMISWCINKTCNFRCAYCTQSKAKHKPETPIDLEKLKSSLDDLGENWIFHLSGGEPFLETSFIKICQLITEKHYLSFNSNLSTNNVFDFAEKVDPQRVLFINAAVHIIEREKRDFNLKKYIEKISFLQKKGFNVIASYVAHPSLFNRIANDMEALERANIQKVRIKIFRGVYNNSYYPSSFNPEERKLLESLDSDYPELEILNKNHNYKGKLCRAGQRFFRMDRAGNLHRCSCLKRSYGNLFNGGIKYDSNMRPCPVNNCGCPYEGIRNILPHRAKNVDILKEFIFEKSLRLQAMLKKPIPLNKIKEKTIEYMALYR